MKTNKINQTVKIAGTVLGVVVMVGTTVTLAVWRDRALGW